MFGLATLFTGPYQLIAKGVALLLLVIALCGAWHAFTGHYVNIGRSQVQSDWDKQKLADQNQLIAAKDTVRAKESLAAINQSAIDNKLLEEHQHEIQSRDTTIANLNSGITRMRIVTGHNESDHSLPNTSTGPSISNETCSVRLPDALGITAIGIGTDSDQVADQLRACQAIIVQDRLTCNGK